MSETALSVQDLRIELTSGEAVVEGVSFSLAPGRVLGLVGESGSGKTTTALALLGYTRPGVRVVGGTISVAGQAVTGRRESAVRTLRGRLVSYVPQDPASALNPSVRVGDQIGHMVRTHAPERDVDTEVTRALELVQLPTSTTFRRRFPHQLSGGQQQRVAIAAALVCRPSVAVLDEPTTGLDVVTQSRLLAELEPLRRELKLAIVYVSHDLAVVASIADEIAVMYAGRVVEQGPAATVLREPRHPYTRGLLTSVPDPHEPRHLRSIPGVAVGVGERPAGCAFAPRCPQRTAICETEAPPLEPVGDTRHVACFEWSRTPSLSVEARVPGALIGRETAPLLEVERLRAEHKGRDGTVLAACDVSFAVAGGECVALVGESGSGKTTIARCVAGLHPPADGRILLDGAPLAPLAGRRALAARRRIQIVFQNPNDSLNPRHRVAEAIARPARVLRGLSRRQADDEVRTLLERVRLPGRLAQRFPGELSGGERQRVAIARALAAAPDLIVCDEITSALDVSVQAAVLEVLEALRAQLGLALLFITHDLGVVASVADRVLVLDRGFVCEEGAVGPLLEAPDHEYTQRLVAAAPTLRA
ncbi:MAG: ABC transporter ATP-binding protein [Actinobacteria bacterium]|nr:MAG: ABC transporter ATP-binding protein [Actinomycetota bacterium]